MIEWVSKKTCRIDNALSVEINLDRATITLCNHTIFHKLTPSQAKNLIVALQDALKDMNLYNSTPKPQKPEEKPKDEPKNIVTGISWKKNTIQLDNDRWIKVHNAKDYKKGDRYVV